MICKNNNLKISPKRRRRYTFNVFQQSTYFWRYRQVPYGSITVTAKSRTWKPVTNTRWYFQQRKQKFSFHNWKSIYLLWLTVYIIIQKNKSNANGRYNVVVFIPTSLCIVCVCMIYGALTCNAPKRYHECCYIARALNAKRNDLFSTVQAGRTTSSGIEAGSHAHTGVWVNINNINACLAGSACVKTQTKPVVTTDKEESGIYSTNRE